MRHGVSNHPQVNNLFRIKTHALLWRHNGRDWRLKSPASRLFAQLFIQAQIKENIKAPPHWPLCREFTGERPVTRKMLQFDDVIMWTSPLNSWSIKFTKPKHNDVMTWKCFPLYWHFVKGNSPVTAGLPSQNVSNISLNKRLNQQSSWRWF